MISKKLNPKEPLLVAKSPEELIKQIILPGFKRYGPKFLSSARPLTQINQRPREVLGLCILSFVGQYLTGLKWTPATDPFGRDGVIYCQEGNRETEGIRVEQVYIYQGSKLSLQETITQEIKRKNAKGKSYGDEYALVIFADKDGEVLIREIIPVAQKSNFDSCWFIGKKDKYKFEYYVAMLKSPTDPPGEFIVLIDPETGRARINKCK